MNFFLNLMALGPFGNAGFQLFFEVTAGGHRENTLQFVITYYIITIHKFTYISNVFCNKYYIYGTGTDLIGNEKHVTNFSETI